MDGLKKEEYETDQSVYLYQVNTNEIIGSQGVSNYSINVNVEGIEIPMDIDTGSAVTLLKKQDFLRLRNANLSTLDRPSLILKGYTGDVITCFGEKSIRVEIEDQETDVKIRVVDGPEPSLLGRDLMEKITLPCKSVFKIRVTVQDVMEEFAHLFDTTTVGKLEGLQVSLRVNDESPVFMKARNVNLAIRERYEKALDKLEEDGIIEKVDFSEWASPTAPIVKADGSLRSCGDYTCTINKFSVLEQYPVPTIEELMGKLQGGKKSTKLDLSKVYYQLEVTPENKKFTTINATKGLYQ